MKHLKLISMFLLCVFAVSACSTGEAERKDSISGTEPQQPTVSSSSAAVTDPDPVNTSQSTAASVDSGSTSTTLFDPREEDRNYGGNIGVVGTQPTEYNGEELSITLEVDGGGRSYDQAFIIFVNGERNEYSTDKSDEKKPYHINSLPEEGTVEVTLYFTPNNCKKGEKAVIDIESMLTPEYMLPDTTYVNFFPHHNITGFLPFEIDINEDTPVTEEHKVFTDFQQEKMTEEFRQQHITTDALGQTSNSLEAPNFVMYSQSEDESIVKATGDELVLNVSAFGCNEEVKESQYMIGIYVDHELQKAFGDNYYALCTIDREYIKSCTAVIDTSELSGLHHIYMIAVPCGSDTVERKSLPIKSASKILSIKKS